MKVREVIEAGTNERIKKNEKSSGNRNGDAVAFLDTLLARSFVCVACQLWPANKLQPLCRAWQVAHTCEVCLSVCRIQSVAAVPYLRASSGLSAHL